MKVSVSNKQIIKLAAPISLALLIPQVSFLTNTAFLGRLGLKELGVNGITGIFYLILAMIGYGLSCGIQVQLSRRAGEQDAQGLAKVFMNGLMLAVLFSLGLMILALWIAPILFGFNLHNSDNVFLSVDFIYIRVWGLPFLMIAQLFNAFYISVNKSKYLIHGAIIGTVVNILFDYMLIFGKWGFPRMGLEGAAVASIISEFAMCATLILLFFYTRLNSIYPALQFRNFDFKLSQRSLNVAAPLIVQFMFSIGGWQIFFIFIEHLGEQELAASQILRSIFGIVGIGTWAFATTCNTMVSNVIGQGRQREVLAVTWKISKLSFLFTFVICIILLSFSKEFLSLYRNDPALVNFAVPSLRVIVVASLIMSVTTVVFNAVVGTGKTRVNLFIEITCVSTYLIYCYFIIERLRSPLYLCWGSEFVYWGSLLLISYAYLKSGRWKGETI